MENRTDSINAERLKQEFSELVTVDSVTFRERQMADILKEKLAKLGFEVVGTVYVSVFEEK